MDHYNHGSLQPWITTTICFAGILYDVLLCSIMEVDVQDDVQDDV